MDETSWWVARPELGEPERQPEGEESRPRLWVFADEDQTVFRVDPRRDREVVHRTLDSEFEERRDALEENVDRLLKPGRADSLTETEDKIRRRLKKQRDYLLVFLDHEKVPATNNRAERRLRPAVMRRIPTTFGRDNPIPRGARTFERMASVAETCIRQGRSVVDYLRATMSLGMQPLPLR